MTVSRNQPRGAKAPLSFDNLLILKAKIMTGKATYTNKVTGKSYKLGFDLSDGDTELSKAWDLVEFVARRNGWNKYDVAVKAGI